MSRSRAGNRVYYYCRTYKDRSRAACTKHTLRHEDLEAAVLRAIQLEIFLRADPEALVEQIGRLAPGAAPKRADAVEQRRRELERIYRYKQSAYQDWKDGELSLADYRRMREDYERQARALEEALEALRNGRADVADGARESPLLDDLARQRNAGRLTRDLLIALVDHISVSEGGRITIAFRFSPC